MLTADWFAPVPSEFLRAAAVSKSLTPHPESPLALHSMSLHVVFAGNLDRDSLKMTDAEDSATPTNPPTPDLALSPGGHAHAVLRHPEKTTMMSPVSDTNPLINTEVAIEKGIDGWPKDPVVLEELLRQADAELRERAKGSVM